jgi:hypothetical protein
MPPTTETDIQELKDLVLGLREEMRTGFVEVKGEIKALDQKLSGEIRALDQKLSGEIKTLDQKFSGEIKSLDQKVSSLDERLKTQDGKFWTLVTIILGTASTLLIKILGFPNT